MENQAFDIEQYDEEIRKLHAKTLMGDGVEFPKDDIKPVGKSWQKGEGVIDWDQICYIRALKYDLVSKTYPNEQQALVIPTAITATKGEVPRVTSHWTLNHVVCPHMAGGKEVIDEHGVSSSWEKPKYIVIAPALSTNEINGKPFNLFGVDTFWKKDVVLSRDAVVINFTDERIVADGITEFVATRPNVDPANISDRVIELLGYSPVCGQDLYVYDRGFDRAVERLAEQEGVESAPHSFMTEGKVDAPAFTLRAKSSRITNEFQQGNFGVFFGGLRDFSKNYSEESIEQEKQIIIAEIYDFLVEYYQSFSAKDIDKFTDLVRWEILDTMIDWSNKDHKLHQWLLAIKNKKQNKREPEPAKPGI